MPRLTLPRIYEISNVLDGTFLTSAGYTITNSDQPTVMVDVVCKDNPKCSIRLGREEKRLSGGAALQYAVQGEALPTALIVKLSPGELMEKESHEVASFEVFLKSPQGWAKRIDDEIKLSTSYQQAMDQFQSELKSKLDENIKDETAQFTEQEKEEIYKMLGELRDRCAALEESKQITPKEFREIETTCQDLAQAANRMPKKVWLRTISSRFYIYSKKLLLSKPGQLAIGEGLKQLIDELPKWMS